MHIVKLGLGEGHLGVNVMALSASPCAAVLSRVGGSPHRTFASRQAQCNVLGARNVSVKRSIVRIIPPPTPFFTSPLDEGALRRSKGVVMHFQISMP